jgi:hypothetical protein
MRLPNWVTVIAMEGPFALGCSHMTTAACE